MLVDVLDRGHQVPALDRLEQRAVLAVVFVDLGRRQDLVFHGVPLVMAANRVDLLVQMEQQGVLGAPGEPFVEHAVVPGKGFLVVPALLEIVQDRSQHLDFGGRRVEHREADHVRFDRQPRLDQLQRADPADDVMRAADRHVVAFDERAAADPPFDQAVGLEIEQDLADGAARGVEPLGELALGGQLVSVHIESAANGLAQLGRDMPDMAAALAEAQPGGRPDFLYRGARVIHSLTLPKSALTPFLHQLVDIGEIGLQLVNQLCKLAADRSIWVIRPCRLPNRAAHGYPDFALPVVSSEIVRSDPV